MLQFQATTLMVSECSLNQGQKWQWPEARRVLKKLVPALIGGLAVAGALAVTWPVVGLFLDATLGSLRPSTVSWDAKNAWVKCEGAIAGKVDWPSAPAAACAAMHLCANEATLAPDQHTSLVAAARRLPDCGDP
jgi:hypothetical protein